ncbi:DUF2157 domain-containing protein [Bacterioplanoides sp. SCSIO 12839]|uniref:DUF2157 domain-containing protein n=1 Tax=Bacterioplanoides sp. SCSIO 12839 TaxID=2829569 RepID=UPI002103A3CD|nr:DUF2157 domain-containing protein [Bacterioplanoides sp. SCSIO 12839]UTW47054.1 DUF2157 domain-containing protein [Bacterioplanoides sp. SCSIO 12839]
MKSVRKFLSELTEEQQLDSAHSEAALKTAGLRPDIPQWISFLDRFLLTAGVLSLAFSLLFFIAYNWQAFGEFARFALVELAVVVGFIGYCLTEKASLVSRISLFASSISVGVLMALFGQVYQTGADTWQLFFNWAIAIFPWVLISRFSVHWLLWIGLLNLSISLYFNTFNHWLWFSGNGLYLVFFLNALVWFFWELAAKRFSWLSDGWSIRIIACYCGSAATLLAVMAIVESYSDSGGFLVWLFWLAVLFYSYLNLKQDLFMLAGGCLSLITVVMAGLLEHVFHFDEAGSFLLLGILLVSAGTCSAIWLRSVSARWSKAEQAGASSHE